MVRTVLAEHFATPEAWETYKDRYPDADPLKHDLTFLDDEDKEEEEGEGGDKAKGEEEASSKKTKKKEDAASEASKLDKAKEYAKSKFMEQLPKLKKKFKATGDKINDLTKDSDPATMGEVAELMAALLSGILFPDTGGTEFLDDVQKRIGLKDTQKEETAKAMAALKAAEMAALIDQGIKDKYKENEFEPLEDDFDDDLYKSMADVFKGEVDLAEAAQEVKEKAFAFLTDMDGDRIEMLKDWVDDEGKLNTKGLIDWLGKTMR